MSEDFRDADDSSTRDTIITVEAEFSMPGFDEAIVQHWPFREVSPQLAKDLVVSNYVPFDATLWWVGLWHGTVEDRPEGGHERGILEEDWDDSPQDDTHPLD